MTAERKRFAERSMKVYDALPAEVREYLKTVPMNLQVDTAKSLDEIKAFVEAVVPQVVRKTYGPDHPNEKDFTGPVLTRPRRGKRLR